MFGDSSPFVRFLKIDEIMRPVIKKEKKQLTTARFLLGSGPSQLFLSFVDAVGAVASSRFRVFASLATPSAHVRRPFRRFAWCCAPSLPASHATGYSLCCAAPRSFGYVPKASTRPAHAARTNHCGGVCTALHSFQRTPPRLPDMKKGRRCRLPSGISNCYSSKPCTTVSSVLESNALAASVTGK